MFPKLFLGMYKIEISVMIQNMYIYLKVIGKVFKIANNGYLCIIYLKFFLNFLKSEKGYTYFFSHFLLFCVVFTVVAIIFHSITSVI